MNSFKTFFLILYLATLVYTVFFLQRREFITWDKNIVQPVPFKNTINSYILLKEGHTTKALLVFFLSNIIGNILLLLPLPLFILALTQTTNYKAVFITGVSTSVLIETIQYLFRIGIPDIDDLILNTTGVAIGIALWKTIFHNRVKPTSS
ncbi:VanZ family protein [Sabulibacter ruber]|uniref:VanZ family protein n=1 Tax=Sabulibacter ruber TaxID=2811901 RepID=UPI001A959289|nr:VanZ family protein [Sabulibacter ruber]